MTVRSFVAKSDERIDFCGAACWKETRGYTDAVDRTHGNGFENEHVESTAEKLCFKQVHLNT